MLRSRLITSLFFALIVFTVFTSRSQAQTTINVPCDIAAFTAAINTANGTPELDTLNLAAGCAYNFTVGDAVNTDSALPLITSPIVINGSGATIARTGGPNFRLFFVHSGGNLTLNGVTIGGGNASSGGGIYNDVTGVVTLIDSTVSGNSAGYGGGIYNDGTVDITNSALSGNIGGLGGGIGGFGGGIYNNGASTLTMTNSTLTGNTTLAAGSYGIGGGILSGGTVTLTNSTVSGNSSGAGGGIYSNSAGTLMVIGSTFSNNSANNLGGGIWTGGTLTVTGSTFSDNGVFTSGSGGTIYNEGTLAVADSTLSGSYALYGGSIYNDGTLQVTNSMISSNGAGSSGGGIYNNGGRTLTVTNSTVNDNYASGSGGGILNGGTLTVTNTTFAGNSGNTGGGIFSNNAGTLTATGSTFSGNYAAANGGGLYTGGMTTVTNCTIASNRTLGSSGGIHHDGGTVTVTNSIVWGNAFLEIFGGATTVNFSDIDGGYVGSGNLNTDPLFVNPILYNLAPTIAGDYGLQSTSPLINAGNNAALPSDTQDLDGDSDVAEPIPYDSDGDARIIDGMVDMGADEVVSCLAPQTIPAADEAALIAAIQCANANPDASVVNLSLSTYSFTVGDATNSDSALPRITTPITINGNGATVERAVGSPEFRLVYVDITGSLTLDTVTIAGGNSANGGAIYNNGTMLQVVNTRLSGNTASVHGGGIFNSGDTLEVINSTLSGNNAAGSGGAIYTAGGTAKVTNSVVSGNHVGAFGGGIRNDIGSTLTVTSSTISGNKAAAGGGIYNSGAGATLTMTNSIVWENNTEQIVGVATVTFSDIQGGYPGIGNLDLNPLFVSPISYVSAPTSAGDYHLQIGSPVSNAGSNAALPADTLDLDGDLDTAEPLPVDGDGDARVVSGTVDMGADEEAACALFVWPYTVPAGDEAALVTAIRCANVLPDANVINLTNSTYTFIAGDAVNSDSALPSIKTPITLNGNGATIERAGGSPDFRLLNVNAGGSLTLNRVTITGGNTTNNGGGIRNQGGTLVLIDSTIAGNIAGNGGGFFRGGGIHNTGTLTVINSTISGNTAPDKGGAIYSEVASATVSVINSTISGNSAPDGGGIFRMAGTVSVTNSIVWGNNTQIYGTVTVIHSLIEGGFAGTGNLAVDPLFVSPVPHTSAPTTAGDYHLQANSPALNVGSNAALPADTFDLDGDSNTAEQIPFDRDGNLRIVNVTVDMGAFEHQVAAGVIVSETNADVTEGGATDTYTVRLASRPAADVTVDLTIGSQASATPDPLTFTPSNWATEQAVTTSAVDDDVAEGAHDDAITHSSASTDAVYNSLVVGSVTIAITDDDVAGVQISVASVDVSEGGATGNYTIVLTSEPTANVIVTPTGDPQCTVSAAVTFTSADWDTPQPVTVTAVDDDVAEAVQSCTVTHASVSSDTDYSGISVADVTGDITDNDIAGVQINVTSVDISEGGTTGIYTIVLTSEPTADVIVTPTGDLQCTVSAPLTFTSADWNTPQPVTVTAVDDDVAEGEHNCTITNVAGGSDLTYGNMPIAALNGTITDNDTAGVTVAPFNVIVAEGGITALYAVSLQSQPTADVTITPTGDADCAVSTALTFTSANWMNTQDIVVTAIDDAIAEGSHGCFITNVASSSDLTYDSILVDSVNGTIADNDTAGVNVAPTTVNVSEGGATATFAVSLTSQPTSDVAITPAGDADCSVSAALVFTGGNWMIAQDITVTALDDSIAEGTHSCAITNAATSDDPVYSGISVGSVDGTITDNDTAGISVEPTVSVTEGGATDTYSVVLTSQPTNSVTITPTGDTQCTVSGAVTFTDTDWNVAQFVTVTAVDDAVAEGNHNCTVTHAATSADPSYDAISVASVTGSVTDDDPFPAELLFNGGMEQHILSNKVPDGWTVSNATLDKLLCKPGKPHAGLCAFSFSGSVGEKAQLSQTVNLTGVTVGAGDTLTLSAYFKGNDTTAKTQLHLIVTYTGNPTPVRSKITVRRNAAYTLVSLPALTLSGPVEKIKVMFKHKSSTGKVLIDGVSLIHTIPGGRGSGVLPPPEVDGFRGGR